MSTERPEFQPIDTAPARRTWAWAAVGAALVVALIWFARPRPAPAEPKPAGPATAAATPESKASAVPAVKAAVASVASVPSAATPKAPEGPNVLGAAVSTAKQVAMVAKAELDRELARTKTAQAQAASYKKQIEDLTKELGAARAQIAAMQQAQKPPPPTDQEQILQTLAPVLRAGGDGRP